MRGLLQQRIAFTRASKILGEIDAEYKGLVETELALQAENDGLKLQLSQIQAEFEAKAKHKKRR